jgi:hypothetical protein
MISREEVRTQIENWTDVERMTIDSVDALSIVDKIYDSIGTCSECKHWDKIGSCVKHAGCSFSTDDTFFCADFERR